MKKQVDMKGLLESGVLPFKNADTIRRKIKYENLPHHYSGRYYFDLDKVKAWWDRHKGTQAAV
jgi:hypothetical protein